MSTPPPDIDVVVVSYESRVDLERCLDAWSRTRFRPLVVENASQDGSAERARSRGADLLELPRNIGFGAAANAGVTVGSSQYVLVSNADAWPQDERAVDELIACMAADRRLGALGPRFVGVDGAPQPTLLPEASHWWTGREALTSFPSDSPARKRPSLRPRPEFLVGATIAFRRAAIEEVGGFDPDFFLFSEEVDLCRRLVAAGWKLGVCGDATMVHVGGAAMRPRWNRVYREQLRSHLRMVDKHEGRRAAQLARTWLTASLALRAAASPSARGRPLREQAAWLRRTSLTEILEERVPSESSAAGAPASADPGEHQSGGDGGDERRSGYPPLDGQSLP